MTSVRMSCVDLLLQDTVNNICGGVSSVQRGTGRCSHMHDAERASDDLYWGHCKSSKHLFDATQAEQIPQIEQNNLLDYVLPFD